MMHARRLLVVALPLVLSGAVVLLTQAAGGKAPTNPWEGLSDAQRLQQIRSAYEAQAAFVRDFVASDVDPRSLRRDAIEGFSAGPGTLDEALAESDVVVVGSVTGVTFEPVADQWMGRAISTVDVERTLKGDAAGEIRVVAAGNPAPTAEGSPELQEIDTAPVLLPGDRVVLMLVKTSGGDLIQLPGSGTVYLVDGMTHPLLRSPTAPSVTRLPERDLVALYLATLARAGGP
jgi:hypothetical protein